MRLAKKADSPAIVQFVQAILLHHEPLVRSLHVCRSSASKSGLADYIRVLLPDSFTLLAVNPVQPEQIVGVAIGRRSCHWDGKRLIERADRTRCDQLRKLLYIWSIVEAEPNLHQHFCTRCLFEVSAFGVYVCVRSSVKNSLTMQQNLHLVFIFCIIWGLIILKVYRLI